MNDPRNFTMIVQGPGPAGGADCAGTDKTAAVPSRIEVIGSPLRQTEAFRLADALRQELGATLACGGPCGLSCWATDSPQTRNLAVAVCADIFESGLELEIRQRDRAGFELVGVVHVADDPATVLPGPMRTGVALRYSSDITDLAGEISELVLDEDYQRRAFISYSHADGFSTADALFSALGRRRFDTYLDRFRTSPGADFVERIQDELVDKSMIVVVESPSSLTSRWVQQEIVFAQLRHYGLLAVNIDGAPPHPWIPEAQRIRKPTAAGVDLDDICEAIEQHHRAAQVDLRRRRREELRAALKLGGTSDADITDRWHGFDVGSTYVVSTSSRPPDLRQARRATDRCTPGATAVLVAPRPARNGLRSDVDWLDTETSIRIIADGQLLDGAQRIARRTL